MGRECGRSGYLLGDGGDGLHGVLGQVAALCDLPFVVGLDQDGASEAQEGFGVGEDTDDVGAAFEGSCQEGCLAEVSKHGPVDGVGQVAFEDSHRLTPRVPSRDGSLVELSG